MACRLVLFCEDVQLKNETFLMVMFVTSTNARPAFDVEQITFTTPLALPVMAISVRPVKGWSEAVLLR